MITEAIPYVLTVTNKGDKIEKVTLFYAEFAPFYKFNSENIEIHLEDGGYMEISCYDDLLKVINERSLSINKIAIKVSNREQIAEEIKLKDYDPTGASISYKEPLFEIVTETEIDAGYIESRISDADKCNAV